MWSFANPNKFMRVSGYVLPVTATIAIVLFAYGIYQGLYVLPPDGCKATRRALSLSMFRRRLCRSRYI